MNKFFAALAMKAKGVQPAIRPKPSLPYGRAPLGGDFDPMPSKESTSEGDVTDAGEPAGESWGESAPRAATATGDGVAQTRPRPQQMIKRQTARLETAPDPRPLAAPPPLASHDGAKGAEFAPGPERPVGWTTDPDDTPGDQLNRVPAATPRVRAAQHPAAAERAHRRPDVQRPAAPVDVAGRAPEPGAGEAMRSVPQPKGLIGSPSAHAPDGIHNALLDVVANDRDAPAETSTGDHLAKPNQTIDIVALGIELAREAAAPLPARTKLLGGAAPPVVSKPADRPAPHRLEAGVGHLSDPSPQRRQLNIAETREPEIRVSIGRIDIREQRAPSAPRPPAHRPTPGLSLSDYLDRRFGRARHE